MKRKIASVSLLLALTVSLYAKGPKPLDPSTIIEPVPLTEIQILVTPNIDTDKQGENYLMNVFPDSIEAIKQAVINKSNITLDATAFLNETKEGTAKVTFEKLDFGAKLVSHKYSWNKEEKTSPRASIIIPFVIRDDGTMPVTVTIYQDDPKDKKGRALTIDLALRPVKQD
jgi:hypothetical protein